jgi:uncharacterized membrane protein YkvA (DUF1232 family)
MGFSEGIKKRVAGLRTKTYTVYLAARDPRTPWYAKVLAIAVVAYALSPIDLIPDFIPGLGYLDDLVIVPLGLALVVKMIPREVMDECALRAAGMAAMTRRARRIAGAVVIAIWLGLLALFVFLIVKIAR